MARASVLINTSLPDINHMGSKTTLDDIKSADFDEKAFEEKDRKAYWIWMAILIIGSMAILIFFSNKMGNLLKIATILSFLTTPFYAIANYLLITSKHTPEFARPGIKMRVLSWLGIIFLTSFSLLYIYHEFL
jgi:Mn2+/Fe2+ NRAMP family transporter